MFQISIFSVFLLYPLVMEMLFGERDGYLECFNLFSVALHG